jgi:hypothetical protein
MSVWILISIVVSFLGCAIAAYALGYDKGWKDARKWGSP